MKGGFWAVVFVVAAVIAGYFVHVRLEERVKAPAPAVSTVQPQEAASARPGPAPAAESRGTPPARPVPVPTPAPAQTAQAPAPASAAAQAPATDLTVTDGRLLARLPNGLTVLIQEDRRFPLVSERLWVRAGSSYEKPGQEGISHLLEHMVFNSTATRPKGGVAKDVESSGGEINAATSFDYTVYMADLPSASWKLGLEVFRDMTFGATFDPEELEREKDVVIAELEKNLDEPGQLLFQMDQGQAFAGKPYEHPIIGFRQTVRAATSQDLHAYVRAFYQPQSMTLVVVGDVDARQAFEEIRATYGLLADDRVVLPPAIDPSPVRNTGPTVKAQPADLSKVHLHLVFPTPGLHSAKDTPLDVLAGLLGGGKTSRLYRKFHYELGLVDDIDASSLTLERGGMFMVDATLSPDKLAAFWPELIKELAGLKADSFSDEQLSRVKLNLEEQLFRAKETLKGLATKLGYYQFFGYGPEGEANIVYQLRSVDREQLNGLLGRYLDPGNASLSILVPGADPKAAEAAGADMLAAMKTLWPRKSGGQAEELAVGRPGAPEVVDFGGGRKVVLLADPTLPYASVTLTYRGGDGLLTPDQQGLAELSAKALTRSTTARQAPALEDFLADRASSVSASAGRDTFTLSARYPARFAGDVLGLVAQVVREPAFDPEEFARARQIQLAQIAETLDKPTGLAFRNLFPFLYGHGHYAYFRAGDPARVATFEPGQARAFWEKQRDMPWVLAVCGVFDRQAVLDLAKVLAKAPAQAAPDFPDPAFGDKRQMSLTLANRNQTHLFWVFPLPGEEHPDTPALEILKTALAGQSGVLFTDLRDKQGLGYQVTAFLWQAPRTGFMALYIGTYPDKAQQSMDGFKAVVEQLKAQGLDEEELERAKSVMEGDYYIDHQSLASRSQEAAANLAMGYALDRDREVIAKAKALTAAEVKAVIARYLDPDKAYLLRIEP